MWQDLFSGLTKSKNTRRVPSVRLLLLGTAVAGLVAFLPATMSTPWSVQTVAAADDDAPPLPPAPEDEDPEVVADEAPPPVDGDDEAPPEDDTEIAPLGPGEAVVTRFSHSIDDADAAGNPIKSIDVNGISASIIDIRQPGEPPAGQHWIDEPQRLFVTAGEVGQVFGVAIANKDEAGAEFFLSATAAFGLHRGEIEPGSTDWMSGMWGPDAGPGTIYRVSIENGYQAEKFADVLLDGRANTGASLGNIAYDRAHDRLFVSDLETGMIHSFDASTGDDVGQYDHGAVGRTDFEDVTTGKTMSLDPVVFDPETSARIDDCPTEFSKTPECWNIADFRRRVWGLDVRTEADGVRLYYSVWGSDAYGNEEWATAGDERRNAVWSVAIGEDGTIDETSVRREFFLPAFWPSVPEMGDKAGNSNAVSDITFPDCGPQKVMLVSERGGMRNLGLDTDEPFSRPYESRVLRYELGDDNIWRAKGRYDVGFHDRSIKEGDPAIFASAAGGADFGYGLNPDGTADNTNPSQSVWMTGDGLCSPDGPCTSTATGEHSDSSEVHGLQGSPADALVPVEPESAAGFDGLDRSYMIDTDINIDADGTVIESELSRNDATKIGDVAIYQVCGGAEPLPIIDVPDEGISPPDEPPIDWPVHNLKQSHEKQASSGHRVKRSWHRREGSWHDVDRSWHWKRQSFHSRNKTWHWREGSWHSKAKSWHRKGQSLHSKRYSWHFRDRSWHLKSRTYHSKNRTWGGTHVKGRTYHVKGRTWSGGHNKIKSFHVKGRTWSGDHKKGRSYHVKGRTWSGNHIKGRTYHTKGKTWGGGHPQHIKGKTYHKKGQTWGGGGKHVKGRTFHKKGSTWGDGGKHVKGKTFHKKGQTWGGDGGPKHTKGNTFHKKGVTWAQEGKHVKGRTFHKKGKTWGDDGGKPKHVKGKTFHVKGKTFGGDGGKPKHVKGKTFHQKGKTFGGGKPEHGKKKSKADQGGGKPKHVKGKSFHVKGKTFAGGQPQHGKKKSKADQQPQHGKKKSKADQQPQHGKKKSKADQQPQHGKKKSKADQQPQHGKKKSKADQQPQHGKKKSKADQGGGNQQPKHRKNKSFHQKGSSKFLPAA